MTDARVSLRGAPEGDGWTFDVTVAEGDGSTRHRVHVARSTLDRLAPGADPEALVRESFAFLLEHEPKEAILREFELPVIARYFPGYEAAVRDRLG